MGLLSEALSGRPPYIFLMLYVLAFMIPSVSILKQSSNHCNPWLPCPPSLCGLYWTPAPCGLLTGPLLSHVLYEEAARVPRSRLAGQRHLRLPPLFSPPHASPPCGIVTDSSRRERAGQRGRGRRGAPCPEPGML